MSIPRVLPRARRRFPVSPAFAGCALPLALGALLVLATGCQISAPLVREHLVATVQEDAGGYAGDARFAALADDLDSRVSRALERLEVVSGLRFPDARVPEVLLRPFGDETVPYELRARIVNGYRRVALHINAEPLLAGTRDVDKVLLRALADAAFQDAAQRHGVVPRWLAELAGTVASGELHEVLLGLRRRALTGDEEVYRLDSEDAAVAVQTGAAALVLLTERGRPEEIRYLLQSVADGDSADAVMGRLAHEPDGTWLRPALTSYGIRLSALDDEPWLLLARAEAAVQESGAAGLEAVLPDAIPSEVQDEITVLRARAAADEGDLGRAAALLAGLRPDAAGALRDPADALALRIRVESHAGGDADLARRLALQLDLDYPRSPAREALRASNPLLGMQEDPQRWVRTMQTRIEREGTDAFDLAVLERYARTLLQDHRGEAARRFLADLGERGTAPELAAVRVGVEEALSEPTQAAEERGAERVARWRQDPGPQTWADVRDTGAPAAGALSQMLDEGEPEQRPALLHLMAETLGPRLFLDILRADWTDNRRFVRRDLEQVAAHVPYPVLVETLGPAQLSALSQVDAAGAQRLWEQMTFGLSARWLETHPAFLGEVRAESYARRQAAFSQLAADAPQEATPAFVAHGLQDPAALLRREAAALAGASGFVALVRQALQDEAWLVREEAARAVLRAQDPRAADALLGLLRADPSVEVRGAAALGLLEIGAAEERVLDALLATQVDEEVRLRDAISTRLAQMDALTVARGIERGWTRALARSDPSRTYLFRTGLLFQRLSGEDLGYYPGAPRNEMRAMLQRIRAWIQARAAAAAAAPVRRMVQTEGRAR